MDYHGAVAVKSIYRLNRERARAFVEARDERFTCGHSAHSTASCPKQPIYRKRIKGFSRLDSLVERLHRASASTIIAADLWYSALPCTDSTLHAGGLCCMPGCAHKARQRAHAWLHKHAHPGQHAACLATCMSMRSKGLHGYCPWLLRQQQNVRAVVRKSSRQSSRQSSTRRTVTHA